MIVRPGTRGPIPRPVADRLMEKRSVSPSGCWLWTGRVDRDGYGMLCVGSAADGTRNASAKVHRVSYETFVGPIPEGLFVLHECDTPACFNPRHLSVGSHADNMRDCVRRGRAATGVRCGSAKLTPEQIAAIRDRYAVGGVSQRALGRVYGVDQTTISCVVRGRTWTHVGADARATDGGPA